MATARPEYRKAGRRERQTEARLIPRLAALLIVGALAACTRPSPEPLRIATDIWPGYEPLYLARELGLYGASPPRFNELRSATAVLGAFRSRSVDLAALTLDEALLLVQADVDIRVVLVTDFSDGADVVLAHPSIANLAELRGRKIGAESSALGAYVLSRALASAGMVPSDVQVVPLAWDKHEEAFLSDQVDAVVTYDPARTRLVAQGARILFDSSKIPGEIADVLVVHGDVLRRRGPEVARILEGWYRALQYLARSRADACERMARREGISGPKFEASLKGLRIPDRAEGRRLLEGPTPALLPAADRLASAMLQARLLWRPVETARLLGPSSRRGPSP
jgi:NitT/TauT family transport system substrate-binding protein